VYTVTKDEKKGKERGIYIGGKADAKNRSKLHRWGITHILNVTPEKEAGVESGVPNYFENSSDIKYKRVPVYDAATSDLLRHADDSVSFLSSALHHGSVLVHCSKGISRSPACVAFFLMRRGGMALDVAMRCLRYHRPEVQPIPAFMEQLRLYEETCVKRNLITEYVFRPPKASPPPLKRKAPIGPCLPPHLSKHPVQIDDQDVSSPAKRCCTSHLEPTQPIIGPQLPQKSSSTTDTNASSSHKDTDALKA